MCGKCDIWKALHALSVRVTELEMLVVHQDDVEHRLNALREDVDVLYEVMDEVDAELEEHIEESE